MKHYVHQAGYDDQFFIESSATNDYNVHRGVGSYVYPQARNVLEKHGISCHGKRAQVLKRSDYRDYDLLIGMDQSNLADMRFICGGDPEGKIHLLLEYTHENRDVADPWYTGDFDEAYSDIDRGCLALFHYLTQ